MDKSFFAFSCAFLFIVLLTIVGAVYTALSKATKAKERKAYEKMITNPSDTTVQEYIPIFLSSKYNITMRTGGVNGSAVTYVNSEKELAEIKSRQAHGYLIISQSPNVSDQVKEQLRKAFVSKGVPIQ